MKPENYDKISELMIERNIVSDKIKTLNSLSQAAVAIKPNGAQGSRHYFYTWASIAEGATLSEKCTDKYFQELKVALALELSEIDQQLAPL